jgi:hypothetical protein
VEGDDDGRETGPSPSPTPSTRTSTVGVGRVGGVGGGGGVGGAFGVGVDEAEGRLQGGKRGCGEVNRMGKGKLIW